MSETEINQKRTMGFENVPLFNGTDSAENWLETFQMFQKVNRWTEDECVVVLPLRLTGPARSWLRSLKPEEVSSWESLKSAFRAQFEVRHSNAEIIGLIARIRQEPNERVQAFQTRFLDLVGLLPNPLPEPTKVEFLVNGLLPSLKEKVTSLSSIPMEMVEVMDLARRFCKSGQPQVPLESGDARVVYHASRDRLDPVEEIKSMIADLQAEVREERFYANRVGHRERENFSHTPVNRNYQGGQHNQPRPRRAPTDGCFICKGPHYKVDCPELAEYELFRNSRRSGNSPASA